MARAALSIYLPSPDILLSRGQVWRIEGDLRGEAIHCEKGELWITQQGDLNDYFVKAGENFWVTRPGLVVVEATQSARFHCTRGNPPKQPEAYAHLGYN
jgi:hypothetical protein